MLEIHTTASVFNTKGRAGLSSLYKGRAIKAFDDDIFYPCVESVDTKHMTPDSL